jgi:hypothetical protein
MGIRNIVYLKLFLTVKSISLPKNKGLIIAKIPQDNM